MRDPSPTDAPAGVPVEGELSAPNLLEVRDLKAGFDTDSGQVVAVDGVSFTVPRGKTLGIVGESGCGKSVTAMSIMRLLPQPMGKILSGEVIFNSRDSRFLGKDLTRLTDAEMRRIRGAHIAMIFQEPMTALNPVHRIGKQLSEVFLLHHPEMSKQEAWSASEDMLRKVGIPAPEIRVGEFPHQLSGGMRQRVVIAMALALKPSLVIADEPTTALDVTIQAQILELMKSLQAEMGMSIILITHDLGVIAETCDDVVVMYAGRVAERSSATRVFKQPQHLYTKGLLESIPRLDQPPKERLATIRGMVPGLDEMPVGARFAPRSPSPLAADYMASERFTTNRPPLTEFAQGHWVENEPAVLVPDMLKAKGLDASTGGEVILFREEEAAGRPQSTPKPEPQIKRPEAEGEAPRESSDAASGGPKPLLKVSGLKMHFPVKGGVFLRAKQWCRAVDGVDFSLMPGETLGLVGESGCGKSTLGKCIVRLNQPTAGHIHFGEQELTQLPQRSLKPIRRDIQMIFQDPAESLNARHTVGAILEEPFKVHGIGSSAERRRRVSELLELVGLRPGAAHRFPFEFSGGQRQRIGIARSIALNPKLVICDEPVSALDVSVQSQILNLMLDLQRQLGLAYLFIAHDLAVVKHISDRIAIMYLGKIVELAPAEEIFRNPLHAYTKALISAIPEPTPGEKARERILLKGDVPSPIDPPAGCAFAGRSWMNCPDEWLERPGEFKEVASGHWVEVHPATVENWEQYR